jgi:hypothetical protein
MKILTLFDLFVSRLENILYKLSMDHHKEEGRFYKRIRERMNRVTQQKLLLRVHFKVAYHAEFRHNTKAALKLFHLSHSLNILITISFFKFMSLKF